MYKRQFYEQLERTGEIALSAMCPDCQSLKFYGKVKKAEKKWVDEVFVQNPGMNEVYPGDTRYILDAFLIYEGVGEWFDLLNYPISRETFSYGTAEEICGNMLFRPMLFGCREYAVGGRGHCDMDRRCYRDCGDR